MSQEEEEKVVYTEMPIREVVNDLATALNNYATAKNDGEDSEVLQNLREKIGNKIKSYQPLKQDGIFEDVISLLPETSMEQFEQIQFNIFNDDDNLSVNVINDNPNIFKSLAKRYLLGKGGLEIIADRSDELITKLFEKISNSLTSLPAINFDIDDVINKLSEGTKTLIRNATHECGKITEPLIKTLSVFELIKNTAFNLLDGTPDEYRHDIWGDREDYVNTDGTLVDPIERIRQDILINFIREENEKCKGPGKSLSTSVNPYAKLKSRVFSSVGTPLGLKGKPKTVGPGTYPGVIRKGGKSKKRRKSGKRKTRRKQKKRKTRRKRRCKK
jgi:hypothetical protein